MQHQMENNDLKEMRFTHHDEKGYEPFTLVEYRSMN